MRRIGVPMPLDENDAEVKLRYSAFAALADLVWTDSRNGPSVGRGDINSDTSAHAGVGRLAIGHANGVRCSTCRAGSANTGRS